MNLFRVVSGVLLCAVWGASLQAQIATPFGISHQVNVASGGLNIPGDAANEPSMCVDPLHPERLAVGWRQFDTVTSDFRQSGWAFSTNGGLSWTFPGVLEPGIFRSDPVLTADADGAFYYLGITNENYFYCDLWRSTNGGASWNLVGPALGGDKEWMAIDTTSSSGHGNFYQLWSPFYNYANNNPNMIFTRSIDRGKTWLDAIPIPRSPYFGTMDIGPNGEVYVAGTDGASFWVSRSLNATNRNATPVFDLTANVDLGGPMIYGDPVINPVGLLGQAWVAADRSAGPTRGNVYLLCSVGNDPGDIANVMFSRSTDGGRNWSAALRINDDLPGQNKCHWFGTLSVAPNGRVDVCWNDTRNSISNESSQLYYTWSDDGGETWAPNRVLSPSFDQHLGYPMQEKIGDYIAMVSLEEGACIAYSATFNGEQDVYFVRAELPIVASASAAGAVVTISWNAVPGVQYCVQAKTDLNSVWSGAMIVGCTTATGARAEVEDTTAGGQKFYRVVRE